MIIVWIAIIALIAWSAYGMFASLRSGSESRYNSDYPPAYVDAEIANDNASGTRRRDQPAEPDADTLPGTVHVRRGRRAA